MFYCKECAKPRNWPWRFARSRGACEICGEVRECEDMPSRYLPMPKFPEWSRLQAGRYRGTWGSPRFSRTAVAQRRGRKWSMEIDGEGFVREYPTLKSAKRALFALANGGTP